MEESKDILMKNRGAGACINDGYNLYFNNIKTLVRS